jgi:hypothetical protein
LRADAVGLWARPSRVWRTAEVNANRSPAVVARAGGLVVALVAALWMVIGADILLGGTLGAGFIDLLNAGPPRGACEGCGDWIEHVRDIGPVILVVALFELIAGLAAMIGKDWGRIVSILYSVMFGVPLLLVRILIPTSAGRNDVQETVAVSTALVIAYAFAAIVLIAWWRGPAARAHPM